MKGNKVEVMIGDKFNNLTVVDFVPKRHRKDGIHVYCRCDCGNITIVRKCRLYYGEVKSCGCAHKLKSKMNAREIITDIEFDKKMRRKLFEENEQVGINKTIDKKKAEQTNRKTEFILTQKEYKYIYDNLLFYKNTVISKKLYKKCKDIDKVLSKQLKQNVQVRISPTESILLEIVC